jgi:hypothetical protein
MNTRNQWTKEKVPYLFSGDSHPVVDDMRALLNEKKIRTATNVKWDTRPDDNNTILCMKCDKRKDASKYLNQVRMGCDSCRKIVRAEKNNWHFAIQKLWKNAKSNSKKRKMLCELSLQQMKEILINQGGLCYYSGVPMRREIGNFKISVERLNTKLSYTMENTVFCCQEFNSQDTSRIDVDAFGSGGWSKEKYATVLIGFWTSMTDQSLNST